MENDQPNKPTLSLSHADQNCKVQKKGWGGGILINYYLIDLAGLAGSVFPIVVHRGGNPRRDA